MARSFLKRDKSHKTEKKHKSSDKPNLNTVTMEEFEALRVPGFTDSRIRSVLDYRKSHGDFENFAECKHIPMLGETMVESLKEHFIIEASDPDDENDEEDDSDEDDEEDGD